MVLAGPDATSNGIDACPRHLWSTIVADTR
jgi:hypothetical protein